jgi:hypothetical protein
MQCNKTGGQDWTDPAQTIWTAVRTRQRRTLGRGGRTALHAASAARHVTVVDRLLKKGANCDAESAQSVRRTALQAAAVAGHLAVEDRLLGKKTVSGGYLPSIPLTSPRGPFFVERMFCSPTSNLDELMLEHILRTHMARALQVRRYMLNVGSLLCWIKLSLLD